MKKINAVIFICFYLFLSKLVFAATVEMDGKSYDCKNSAFLTYNCMINNKLYIVSKNNMDNFVAVSRDNSGTLFLKGVSKVVNGSTVEYQIAGTAPLFEDTIETRLSAADIIMKNFGTSSNALYKDFIVDAKNIHAYSREPKSKVKVFAKETGETYECTAGTTRAFNNAEIKLQERYATKFTCPFYACTGKNPNDKVLLNLPKSGSTFSAPSLTILNGGKATHITEEFRVTDGSSIPYYYKGKRVEIKPDADLPEEDLNIDLLIPSSLSKDRPKFDYLMGIATKNDQSVTSLIDLCRGDKNLEPLFTQQQIAADKVQETFANTEIIEYLKLIDKKIVSFYIDRSKGLGLGCLYQDKVVDRSVMEKFEHLKEISRIKSTQKFLKPEEVQELFKKAKNMKDIPFGYKYDGCYARAHIMARRFEEMGIPVQKAWIKGKLSVPNTDIRWDYHVAPSVPVKEKNGQIVNYVIDPSLTDKAVPLDEWVASMNTGAKSVLKTTYPFPDNGLMYEKASVALSNTDNYAPNDIEEPLSERQKMDISKQRLKAFSEILESNK